MKFLFLPLFLVLTSLNAMSAISVQLAHCSFYSANTGPYIELYMSFETDSLILIPSDNGFFGEFEVSCTFTKKGRDSIIEKFTVKSPGVSGQGDKVPPFVSQNRFFLENGEYTMKVAVRDKNGNKEALKSESSFKLDYNDNDLKISDIEVFQSSRQSADENIFSKNGFEIIPYVYEIVPPELNQIGFYMELYNADKTFGKDSSFLITYYLESFEGGQVSQGFRGFSRKKASSSNILMGKFIVSELKAGNYNMCVDVLTKSNELVASKKIAFHKSNPDFRPPDELTGSFVDRYTSTDSLATHIKYLEPIADQMEWEFAKNQLSARDPVLMKKYFLNFWEQRNPDNPEQAWYDYYKLVLITIENFTTPMRPGYLSDRGYRYLKYGKPDDRYESFDEPYAFPHEVWWYYKVKEQSNRMIIFCNKSQVLNDYVILHSDINGELSNKDWNLELHRMAPGYYDDEQPAFMDYFGNKAKDWSNLPR